MDSVREEKKEKDLKRVRDFINYLNENGIKDEFNEIPLNCTLFSINPNRIPNIYKQICEKEVPIMTDHGRIVLVRPFVKKWKLKDYLE